MPLKNKNSFRDYQSGRSMIEMLGVLAIIGVLSAGGIAGYTMAMATFKSNKAMDMVQIISAQAKQLYGDDFSGISESTMYSLGYLSSEYMKPGSTTVAQSPFGSTVTIAPVTGNASFTITVADVPKAACVKLLQSYWGDSTFFVSIKIGNEAAAASSPASPITNASTAIAKCAAATNKMIWEFK